MNDNDTAFFKSNKFLKIQMKFVLEIQKNSANRSNLLVTDRKDEEELGILVVGLIDIHRPLRTESTEVRATKPPDALLLVHCLC